MAYMPMILPLLSLKKKITLKKSNQQYGGLFSGLKKIVFLFSATIIKNKLLNLFLSKQIEHVSRHIVIDKYIQNVSRD